MIIHSVFYAIKCNRCGEIYSGYDDGQYWSDESIVEENAEEDDWITEPDGKHYCPGCYISVPNPEDPLSEDDEINVPKPRIPDRIFDVRKFITQIVRQQPDLKEFDDRFELVIAEYHRRLYDPEEAWISSKSDKIERVIKTRHTELIITFNK